MSYTKSQLKGSFSVPALLFADDTLLFCKATNSACSKLKVILDNFGKESGQMINYHKSFIIYSKSVTLQRRNMISGLFNITSKATFGKYLGLHFGVFKPDTSNISNIWAKINERISNWGSKFLPKAGRTALIQSNLESIPSFSFGAYSLSRNVAKQMDALHRNFFWGKTYNVKGCPLVAWEKICKPKRLGGLGLRKMECVNKAYLAKWCWNLFMDSSDNVWVRLVKDKYFTHQKFMDYKIRNTDSPIIKDILK